MTLPLLVAPDVAHALAAGAPVVALESTVIAHGLPAPRNLDLARACEAAVRARGVTPATVAVIDGQIVVGCTDEQIQRLAAGGDIAKISRRDLAAVIARGGTGATTVAGTVLCAAAAGIAIMATGGIGGVHRGGETSLDISADLSELARSPVAVVCSGAKSILDLPRTLEVLETNGVPVAGYGTSTFPAFFSASSGLSLDIRVDGAGATAGLIRAHRALPGAGGIVIANPVPHAAAIPAETVDRWIEAALAAAHRDGIAGKAVTPFLLKALVALSAGATLNANVALLVNNAAVAADIAVALAEG